MTRSFHRGPGAPRRAAWVAAPWALALVIACDHRTTPAADDDGQGTSEQGTAGGGAAGQGARRQGAGEASGPRGDDVTHVGHSPDAPTRPVLAAALAAALPAPDVAPYAADAALTPDERESLEFARAMAGALADDPSGLAAVRKDIAAEGEATVRALVTVALDPAERPDARVAAVDLLPATRAAAAAHALARVADAASEPWLRRSAHWRARELADVPGADGALVALVLRLKYETDDEALVWLAGSLGDFGVLAGAEALARVGAASSPAAAAALAEATRLMAAFPAAGEAPASPAALAAAWAEGATPPGPAPSAELTSALWRAVAELSGERFQLRGVDDARYALARLPASAAPLLGSALEDADPFVRLHVLQVLERMGGRALAADLAQSAAGAVGPVAAALLARLDDAHIGVAAAAAEALGATAGGAPHVDSAHIARELARRTGATTPHELRVAAVRGLGRLGRADSREVLESLAYAQDAPGDLRLAALEGLVRKGAGDPALGYLSRCLSDPLSDAGEAERLLGLWLDSAAARSAEHAAARDLWHALAPPFERVHTPVEVRARRRARAALIGPFVTP